MVLDVFGINDVTPLRGYGYVAPVELPFAVLLFQQT